MCRSVLTYVVCKTALLRDGITRVLSKTRFRVVGVGYELSHLKLSTRSDRQVLYILCMDEPDSFEETINVIREKVPGSRIVVLAPISRLNQILVMFRLGAHGYLNNTISADALVKSLEIVMVDSIVLPSEGLRELLGLHPVPVAPLVIPSPVADPPRPISIPSPDACVPTLSERETLILRALVEGDSNKHIARRLAIAEATVKVHVKAILRKVRVRNRTQAAIWAIGNGHGPRLPCEEEASDVLQSAVANLPLIGRSFDEETALLTDARRGTG